MTKTHTTASAICCSALLASLALLLASCGGNDPAPRSRVRLVQTDSTVGLAAFKALEPASAPINIAAPLVLTGLAVAGVPLPTLDRFGATPYVDIAPGTYDLPGLPTGDFGRLVVQSVTFAPGASVSLIRSPNQVGWTAVVEQPNVDLDAGQAEISLLNVTMQSIATEVQGQPAKLILVGPQIDQPFIAEYALNGAEPLRNMRVPSSGFRIRVQGNAPRGGPIVFQSEVIKLAQGSHWSGTLHLSPNASGQSLVLHSESTPTPTVVLDERAQLRLINAASVPVGTRLALPNATYGAFIALPVGGIEAGQVLVPSDNVFVYTQQNNSPTPVYQSMPLPPPIPGRGYDIVVRDGATPGTLAASLHPHVAASAATGTGGCWSLRMFNALATFRAVAISGRISSPEGLFPGDVPVPFVLPPLLPSEIRVYGSVCGSAAARFAVTSLSVLSVDVVPALLIRFDLWPSSQYAQGELIGVVGSGGASVTMVPPINALLIGSPEQPVLRLYPRTP